MRTPTIYSPYGYKATPEGASPLGIQQGNHYERFESKPPPGAELTRSQRRALALVTYTQMQATDRFYGGRRITHSTLRRSP